MNEWSFGCSGCYFLLTQMLACRSTFLGLVCLHFVPRCRTDTHSQKVQTATADEIWLEFLLPHSLFLFLEANFVVLISYKGRKFFTRPSWEGPPYSYINSHAHLHACAAVLAIHRGLDYNTFRGSLDMLAPFVCMDSKYLIQLSLEMSLDSPSMSAV